MTTCLSDSNWPFLLSFISETHPDTAGLGQLRKYRRVSDPLQVDCRGTGGPPAGERNRLVTKHPAAERTVCIFPALPVNSCLTLVSIVYDFGTKK